MNDRRNPKQSIVMKPRSLVGFMILIGLSCMPVDASERPNIIFILADDLGFNQIGAYGDTPIKTPRLTKA